MVTHPRDMTAWDEIACQRGCAEHYTRRVHVDLAKPHRYTDLPQVPAPLAVSFDMEVWDTDRHPVDADPRYCPAHDAVSETILSHGIWEPRETILTLDVFRGGRLARFMDFGAHIGWFSMLALAHGLPVQAVEADPLNMTMWMHNQAGVLDQMPSTSCIDDIRISPDMTLPRPVRRGHPLLVKMDLEGAEPVAVDRYWPAVSAADHLLIEVSPCFHDGYPAMLARLIDSGYAAFTLPPKGELGLVGWRALAPYRFDRDPHWAAMVAGWHQANVWLTRRDLL